MKYVCSKQWKKIYYVHSIMFGMKRILDDVFIFVAYHKKKAEDERNYIEGKPDYADVFEDNMIFRWDSKIGMGVNSAYMKDVTTAPRKHLFPLMESDSAHDIRK